MSCRITSELGLPDGFIKFCFKHHLLGTILCSLQFSISRLRTAAAASLFQSMSLSTCDLPWTSSEPK